MKKDLSQLVGHKEGRSVSFGLHVSHVGCSGGVDMVGRKHLERKITTSSNGETKGSVQMSSWSCRLEAAHTIPAMGAGVLSV